MPAVFAPGAGKTVGEDAAFQILLERFAHVGLRAVVVTLTIELACAGQLKPSLAMLRHCLVEQRALRVARVVALGFGGGWHEYCANTQDCANFSSTGLRSKTAQGSLPGPFLDRSESTLRPSRPSRSPRTLQSG